MFISRFSFALCFFLCAFQPSSTDVSTPHQCLPLPSEKCFTVIVDQKLNWNDAEKYCENNLPNGRLASIHNAFEGAVIASWLPFLTTDPWIGAYQVGSLPFQWTDASPLDYANWLPGQPTSNCAQVCYSSATNGGIRCQQGKWRTADCETNTAQIICEYGNFSNVEPPTVVEHFCNSNNGKCFTLVAGSLEWSEAEKFCRTLVQNGTTATLASITSQSDADILAAFLRHPNLTNNVWIGAFAVGGPPFIWADKSIFSYSNWAPGQPPVNPDGCVEVCLKNDASCTQGKWVVAECKTQQSFVCGNTPYNGVDCLEIKQKYSNLPSGTYMLTPAGIPAFSAYCDMDTDGGGWTIIQRRMDAKISFFDKSWNQYKNGFNNGLSNSLWLGNDKIHALSTKDANVELRIDLWGDRAPGAPNPNIYLFGKYPSFYIENEANYYKLHFSSSSVGNASDPNDPDGIISNNGHYFSTFDADHSRGKWNCSMSLWQYGGWWSGDSGLSHCGYVSLNGMYVPPQWHDSYGLTWYRLKDNIFYNPAQTRMMIRSVHN